MESLHKVVCSCGYTAIADTKQAVNEGFYRHILTVRADAKS